MRRSALLLILASGATCRAAQPLEDPFEDALHVPRVGREVPDDTAGAPPPETPAPQSRTKPTPGRYGTDIDALQRVVEKGWASRARHEELDGVDIDKVFEDLRTRVKRSTTRTELARAVRTALCRLGDGHLRLLETSRDVRTLDSGVR